MSFLLPALAGIGGGSPLAGALSAASSVGGLALAAKGQRDSKAAQDAALKAGVDSQVDIKKIDDQTREIAKRNAEESAALERAMTPEVPELRREANMAVRGGFSPSAGQESAAATLASRIGTGVNTPLLQAAIDKARADLALGGRLDVETQNAATRGAAATAGRSFGNLGLGRDLAARDLGLTSMQIAQKRLENAEGLGARELGREQFDRTNFLDSFSALNNYYNANRDYALGAAKYGESIEQPIVGIDPTTAANLTISNANERAKAAANMANIQGTSARNLTNLGGQFLGLGLAGMKPAPKVPGTGYSTPGGNVGVNTNWSFPNA
jgi:hypothetical protein